MFIKSQVKKGRVRLACCGIFLFSVSFLASAQMRMWHDKAGNEYEGEYSKEAFGKIFLRAPDGKLFSFAVTNLIDSDIVYLRAENLPELDIGFSVKREERPYDDFWMWPGNNEIDVTGTATVRKKSRGAYTGKLRGEMFLIGEEVATEDYRLFAKKEFEITFSDENKNKVVATVSEPLRNYIEFNEQPRGAFYEGFLIIVSDKDGNLVTFNTNLSWITADKFDNIRRFPVPGFFDRECRKRPVPRPDSWDGENEY